jgi:GNAT superfamily N-acetyltransferase
MSKVKFISAREEAMVDVLIRISPPVSSEQLNDLFATAWENHKPYDFQPVIKHSLLYVCAYHDEQIVGYVNMAWDGGIHGFLLDTTVHADYQRQGIGVRLVQAAVDAARARGIEWVHVDYESHLDEFYRQCGFRPTEAGLINLWDG